MSVIPNMTVTSAVDHLIIIVTPTPKQPSYFDACVEGGCVIVRASRQPFVDAARVFINHGVDPSASLEMRHHGSAHCALRATLAHAAMLAVEERKVGGKPPRFVPYRPFNRAAGVKGIVPDHRSG